MRSVLVAIALPATAAAIAAAALVGTPHYFLQPLARNYLFEFASVLLLYSFIALFMGAGKLHPNRVLATTIGIVGFASGVIESGGILLENGIPFRVPSGIAMAIPTLIAFALWGLAAYGVMRRTASTRTALLAAVGSAMVCMMVAVTAGLLIELVLVPGDPAEITKWSEYMRSGWTDPVAFRLANTLDEAAVHLFLGPVVAAIVGLMGLSLAALLSRANKVRVSPKP